MRSLADTASASDNPDLAVAGAEFDALITSTFHGQAAGAISRGSAATVRGLERIDAAVGAAAGAILGGAARRTAGIITRVTATRNDDVARTLVNTNPSVVPPPSVGGRVLDSAGNGLEVGRVSSMRQALRTTGDGTIRRDHQPAYSALRLRAIELNGGRPLTPAQERRLYQEAQVIQVDAPVHRVGSTYGRQTTHPQTIADSQDLVGSVRRTTTETIENTRNLRPRNTPAVRQGCQQLSCMTNEDYDDFLRRILDDG